MSSTIAILLLIAFIFVKDEEVLYVKHKSHDIVVLLFNKFAALVKKIYKDLESMFKEFYSLKIQLRKDKKVESNNNVNSDDDSSIDNNDNNESKTE